MRPQLRRNTRWLVLGGAATALVLAGTAPAPGVADRSDRPMSPGDASRTLRQAVKPRQVLEHLQVLDRIAAANNDSRASGTPGYTASRDYVVETLRAAGYKPTVQKFDFIDFEELSPSTLRQVAPDETTYENPQDFITMEFSAAGEVSGQIEVVDTDLTATDESTSGCEAADFAGFPAGAVALIQRGTCTFADKVANAADAGAAAAVIFNRGTEGATDAIEGTLGAPSAIPALGASFSLGQDLADPTGTEVALTTDTKSTPGVTYNITAQTKRGNDSKVVLAGAHLDGAAEGASINDNGSGAATILEVAEQMAAKNIRPKNTVRFAWWGAEEQGLVGSQYYLDDLYENNIGALEDIRLYMNFDMLGSPNFVRFIFDGDNSRYPVSSTVSEGPPGSGAIERVFRRYFEKAGLASAQTPFDGRTDYGPFVALGIPAGGLFTGAEGVKTERQAARFGGTAGEAYDECYHEGCDTLGNINRTALDQMSDATAHAVARFAMDVSSLDGPAPARAMVNPKKAERYSNQPVR